MLKSDNNERFQGLKSTPLENFYDNISDQVNKQHSKSKNINYDDSSDDEDNLFQVIQKYKTCKSEVKELSLEDYIPTSNSELGIKSTPLDAGSLSDLSGLLKDLEQLQLGTPLKAPSRLSMVLLDNPKEDMFTKELTPVKRNVERTKTLKKPLVDLSMPSQRINKVEKENNNNNNDLDDIKNKINLAKDKLQEVKIKKITTKIYINNEDTFHSVQLTSLSTPNLIIKGFIEAGILDKNIDYILIERNESFGVERNMNYWEPILNIIENWESESFNALLIRPKLNELTIDKVPLYSPVKQGSIYLQIKKGKWEKRTMSIKHGQVYLSKSNGNALLCSLENFDTFNVTRKTDNTHFMFALKSHASILLFEKPEEDYIHFFKVENQPELNNWIHYLRYSRAWLQLQQFLIKPINFSPFLDESILDINNTIQHIEYDTTNQLKEIINNKTKDYLTSETASGLAKRLFKLVMTGDQGKTNIDKVVGSKQLPNVFQNGSLLSNPPKVSNKVDEEQPQEPMQVFKEGSLLSKKNSIKYINNNNNNPLLNRNYKPQNIIINNNKEGTLLEVKSKDHGLFSNGLILNHNKNNSIANNNNNIPNNKQPSLMTRQFSNGKNQPSLMQRSNSNTSNNSPKSASSVESNSFLNNNTTLLDFKDKKVINTNNYPNTLYNQMNNNINNNINKLNKNNPPIAYNKGSLLDQYNNKNNNDNLPLSNKLNRAPSYKENNNLFKKNSLLSRKKSINQQPLKVTPQLDTNNTLIKEAGFKKYIPNNGPLLKLDDTKEAAHTNQIRKHGEPLISFK